MSDLRTGLVEAMALSMYDSSTRELRELESPLEGDRFELHVHAYRQYAEAALDVALAFLSENAPRGLIPLNAFDLLAVLSDSRDTGEKPDA